MLNRIIKFSLNNKLLILLAVVLITVGGIYSAKNIEVDVFPDLTMPTVVILTDASNMAPEEVERLVTFPIETAVNGATNVRRVRSSSSQGFSFVWVEFDWGMDIYRARQVVEIEAAGHEVLPGLLAEFTQAGYYLLQNKKSGKYNNLQHLIPPDIRGVITQPGTTVYMMLRAMLDFVSGLTDRHALGLYRKIKGISL
jgi:hypothetical protein